MIEQNKDGYYEALEACSRRWHEGRHDPWRFINFMLLILEDAYREFQTRVGQTAEPRGAKGELILMAVSGFTQPFRLSDVERACPGVSRDFIRLTLRKMKAEGAYARPARTRGTMGAYRGMRVVPLREGTNKGMSSINPRVYPNDCCEASRLAYGPAIGYLGLEPGYSDRH